MKIIPTRLHGVLDYSVGAFLIAAPSLLGLKRATPESRLLTALGVSPIVYAALTDYELGLWRVLPMPAHLAIDAGSGALMAASPWLLGFARRVWLPHLAFGLFELAVVALSQTRPGPAVESGS